LKELYSTIAEALASGEPVAVATVVQVEGSAPRSPGAQMLVHERGRILGTVGGGALEASVLCDAHAALGAGQSALREYSLQGEDPAGVGVCGGRVQVFIHVLQPSKRVVIAGAGHVAEPLAQLAAQAGFQVLVVDDRPECVTAERFPSAETRVVSFPDLCSQVPLDGHTSVIIVTRSHEHDEVVLRQLLDQPLAYLGLMGSRAKVRRMFQQLRSEGYSAGQLERVHAPIGLDIGAETPAELAVSIVAELVQARRGGSGLPMSQVMRAAGAAEGA
jgi:xanthine dehydrogenase accessory factor